jgi:hypothetical protein
MYVDHDTLKDAAMLILGAIENGLPVEHVYEDEDMVAVLQDVLDELTVGDLLLALERAGERLPEPDDEDGD